MPVDGLSTPDSRMPSAIAIGYADALPFAVRAAGRELRAGRYSEPKQARARTRNDGATGAATSNGTARTSADGEADYSRPKGDTSTDKERRQERTFRHSNFSRALRFGQ